MSSNDGQSLASSGNPDEATPPAGEKAVRRGTDWWAELRAIFWLVLAVIGFHSLVAKPFYIPSESMMPALLEGDRLVVSKYPYGWSWVSPSFHFLPHWQGRLLGSLPERGDVVIVTPPGETSDYIKRVIGLPGDTISMTDGQLFINGQAVRRQIVQPAMIPVDENAPCEPIRFDGREQTGQFFRDYRVTGDDGRVYCRVPIIRETLPNGASYDTIDDGNHRDSDNFAPIVIPEGHVWLMGDNRDHSSDSRFPVGEPYRGLGGPVPWENIGGRAEFLTFSLDGSSQYWNPISWFTAMRSGRAGTSLRPERTEQPSQ